jgi:hypothetical protein
MDEVNGKAELLHKENIVVKQSRLFEILFVAHTTGGHCGRDAMIKKLTQYFGITQ